MPFRVALARVIDFDAVRPQAVEPDYEDFNRSREEYKIRQREMTERRKRIEENQAKSKVEIEEFFRSVGADDEEQTGFADFLQGIFDDVFEGKMGRTALKKLWQAYKYVEECIGTWRGHLDQDLVIWKAVQIARYFNSALLVVESNSLDVKGDEGDHSLTILDEIKDFYPHLYCRTDPQKIREGLPARYGFHTNAATKTDLVNQMNKRFREGGHIERDGRALDEADCYEIKPDGSYGAVDGEHDDIYMSRAIGLKASQTMDPPAYQTSDPIRPRRNSPVLTESNV